MRADLAITTPVSDPATTEDLRLESEFEIPERPRFMVTRPRLLEGISGSAAPVTLVVGPAGSGKTQLVASWVTSPAVRTPVAWISLEDDDDQTHGFWAYVVAALWRAGVPVSSSLVRLSTGPAVNRPFLVRLAAELSDLQVPVLLVLDGVSNLTGERWATDLEFVLRHTSPSLRLVLIGRWDPPMPLHRYRLAGRLTEVRGENLAFTAEETAELLALHGVELSPPALSSLLEHTEGWAAGLRLFAMALRERRDADHLVETITGSEATIAEYFVKEVLRLQPAHVRAFLLEASILDTFTPELAEAVTGRTDARRLLVELARRNTFVQPAAEYSPVYRFHRLFAEMLRAQLMCEEPERTAQLHRRAAAWLATEGQTNDAVSHAVKGRDWATAATIVVDHYAIGRVVLDGRAGTLGALLRHLPEDADDAEVAIVSAALALADGSVERCAHQLGRAQELVMRRGWEYSHACALADLLLGVLLAGACTDHTQVLLLGSAAEHALAHAPPEELTRHPELRILLLAAKGFAQSGRGAVDTAAMTLTEATAVTVAGCEYPQVECLQHLALIEAYRGRLRHAEKLATEAIGLADQYGLEPARRPVDGHLALAWVAMERYDVNAAGRHLRIADPRHRQPGGRPTVAAFALVKSRRLQARGELRSAVDLIEKVAATTGGPRPPEWLAREIALSRVRLMIATGRSEEALAAIRRFTHPQPPDVVVLHAAALAATGETERARETVLPVVTTAGLAPPVAVEAWLVIATVAAHLGAGDEVRGALRHALRLAAPEAHRRVVQQVWAELRRVLRDDDELTEQYQALMGSPPVRHRRAASDADALVIVESLSRREMEVLRGMAGMLPTEEIAATLYVSVNTVKSHVRSILRKLSASGRNEAVRRARALGLISTSEGDPRR